MKSEKAKMLPKGSSPITKKKTVIYDLLDEILKRKNRYYKRYKKLKKINSVTRMVNHGLNALAVGSLVSSLSPAMPIFMIVALVSTSASTVSGAVLSATNIEDKLNRHHTTFSQYCGLHRDLKLRLLKNHLTSEDYEELIGDIHAQISLIEDSSVVI